MKTPEMFRGKVRRIHFVGIGGVGMSGIAEVLLELGFEVHGSDLAEGDAVARLRAKGAVVHVGHAAAHIEGADVVVKSTAVTRDNVEVDAAFTNGIPVIRRAEMLAELMRLGHGVAVAGTHGKTTTTSLVSAVLNHGGVDPTVIIGGKVNQLGTNARLGRGPFVVAEADESDGSFLKLAPTIAVVTNLDLEHVDFWQGGLDEMKGAFVDFLERLPFYGLAILCTDDANVQSLLPKLSRRHVSYGLSRQADYQAREVQQQGLRTKFRLVVRSDDRGIVDLNLAGEHNVLNALASIAVADELGVDLGLAAEALAAFEGVQRRFTLRGEAAGVTVIDDYGHHPTELKATLSSARACFPGRRVIALFQPHRFTRTHALMEDFARAFNDADVVVLTDVYAAGEAAIEGADAAAMAVRLRDHGHHDVRSAGALERAIDEVAAIATSGDIVLTLGAGSVTRAGPAILSALDRGDDA